ncbi:MAG: TonB-dependent receptor [Chitinophagaceae bacterium]|nr:TonB-dependent receptor [Chitinophagaceae bacterium]
MRKVLFIWMLMMSVNMEMWSQVLQTVKGTVVDKETKQVLPQVTVRIFKEGVELGGNTDENGEYRIDQVPVGSYTIQFTALGFRNYAVSDVQVNSAKEYVQNAELEDATMSLKAVEIKTKKKYTNEMGLVSIKQFDVQETERYAGSRGDPARMASNFAGVQGADDSRNDIVIRGNSPQGVLWRLENVDIPNPNHFNVPGTTGGPVSMLNNKMLSNSDFFTGAFPSDYGNSTAGVFDLQMRNGNKDRYEFTAQFGFLGTELGAEGPISKKKGSSFLFNYRYSTLKLFDALNIKIGTNSVPAYQDASFKLNFPLGKKTKFSLWGLGGLSKIDLIVNDQTEPPTELYGESDRDQYFKTNMGVVGANLQHNINSKSYTRISAAVSNSHVNSRHDKVFRDSNYAVTSLKPILGYDYRVTSILLHALYNVKLNAKWVLKAGLINNTYLVNLTDSSRQYPPTQMQWQIRNRYTGTTNLSQAYMQLKYRLSPELTMTGGLHAQYLSHSQSFAIEPRFGLKYLASPVCNFTFGYGLHSQMQQLYQYFAQKESTTVLPLHNYAMGFTKSHHLVLGNEYSLGKHLSLRTEVYYQYLYNIPIEKRAGSSFSAVNQGGSFSRLFPDTLVNNGTAYNYGLEMTLSKAFSQGYYFLLTGTLFNSKAKGNDQVYRNTDYNGRYILNALVGYNIKVRKNNALILGAKVTYAGGQLYSPPDSAASVMLGDLVVVDSLRNTLKFKDYFRVDFKLGYKINRPRVTHEIAIDLVNVFNIKNILSMTYSPDLAAQGAYPFTKTYQLGFLPLFYYRLDWHD